MVLGWPGISWTICKQSAPRSRQITTPTPHHSIFYRPDALPDAQPTVSKHCRQQIVQAHNHIIISKSALISFFFKSCNRICCSSLYCCRVTPCYLVLLRLAGTKSGYVHSTRDVRYTPLIWSIPFGDPGLSIHM